MTRKFLCKITGPATIDDIKACVQQCDVDYYTNWFGAKAKKFFGTRLGRKAYADKRGGAFFTTSEKYRDRRAYSVRYYDPKSCRITTVGEFMGYKTAAAAKAAARKLAKKR